MAETVLDTRPSSLAGKWYPADPGVLAAEIDRYLAAARKSLPPLEGDLIGVVAPHAGVRYSGPVAGYAFAAAEGLTPDWVAVLSPMHYPYRQPLLTTAHQAYATPLGVVPVDADALTAFQEAVKRRLGYSVHRVANDPEHALEIELPFLQRALAKPFRLLPIMLRDYRPETCQAVGEALAEIAAGQRVLLVASSDLSHYYPEAVARPLDEYMLAQMAALNPEGVLRAEEEGRGFACGAGPVAAMLWAAKALGANRGVILRRASSGDVTGDYRSVVGYGAVAVLRQGDAK